MPWNRCIFQNDVICAGFVLAFILRNLFNFFSTKYPEYYMLTIFFRNICPNLAFTWVCSLIQDFECGKEAAKDWIMQSRVDVLKFWTLVACKKCSDKQCRPRSDCFWRSSLIWVCTVCSSDNHLVYFSPDTQLFIWEQKEKKSKF